MNLYVSHTGRGASYPLRSLKFAEHGLLKNKNNMWESQVSTSKRKREITAEIHLRTADRLIRS